MGLLTYAVISVCPALLVWLALRIGPVLLDAAEAWQRRRHRRQEPEGPPLEKVVAAVRRLRREIRSGSPTTHVRARALAAAYDDVLVDLCRIVGVDTPLACAEEADRPFARLQTEAALEQAGIALDPPGSVTAG